MEALGLHQWVDLGTHHLSNTIDLVFTELASNSKMLKCTPGPVISDNYAFKCEKYKRENITYLKINKINTDAFVKDLVLKGITDDLDPAMMIHVFQHKLSRVLNKHAPMVAKGFQLDNLNHCLMKISKNKSGKHEEERGYGESTENHQCLAFKAEKQQYRLMLKDAKTKVLSNLIIERDMNIKKLYQVIYNMMDKCSINPLPGLDSDEELPNKFADFFIKRIKTIPRI